jgi:hypothetical protein
MVVCIFEHVQWRWALNDSLALGYARRSAVPLQPVAAMRRTAVQAETAPHDASML